MLTMTTMSMIFLLRSEQACLCTTQPSNEIYSVLWFVSPPRIIIAYKHTLSQTVLDK